MDLLTFMQLVPTTQQRLCVQYMKDGFRKIQEVSNKQIDTHNIDIVSGTSEYSFPSDFVSYRNLLINTDVVENHHEYIASVEGRKIVLKKYNSNGELGDPDTDYTDGLILVYTSNDGLFDNAVVA